MRETMNATCAAQIERLRDEFNGRLIPLWSDDRSAIICFVPDPAMPDVSAEACARHLLPGVEWERAVSPVLIYCDWHRAKALLDPGAVDIAACLARGEKITCELVAR
jgi:hypothetical protein